MYQQYVDMRIRRMNAYINEHGHSFFSLVCYSISRSNICVLVPSTAQRSSHTFCTTMTIGCKYFISATKKEQRQRNVNAEKE